VVEGIGFILLFNPLPCTLDWPPVCAALEDWNILQSSALPSWQLCLVCGGGRQKTYLSQDS